MDKYAHISNLVRKLFDNNLTQTELSKLQHLFRSDEAQGDVDKWLTDLWKSSEQQHRSVAPPRTLTRIVRPLMRYAAVFMLAVTLCWLWFGNEKTSDIEQPAQPVSSGISEVSVTYGSKTRILLPDSSVVFLNSGSQLSYSPHFDRERHVTLTGEGYFVVRTDSLRPFWVHTNDVIIKALGTEFNVKAFPEEDRVETFLVSGVVEILKTGQTRPIVELKPGEKAAFVRAAVPNQKTTGVAPAIIAKEQPQMIVSVEQKPDVSIGWVENQLIFDAETFGQIAVRLERWFNVEIDIHNEDLKNKRLSGRYDTENIQQVMHSLRLAIPFTYRIEKNKIIIK